MLKMPRFADESSTTPPLPDPTLTQHLADVFADSPKPQSATIPGSTGSRSDLGIVFGRIDKSTNGNRNSSALLLL